MNNSTLIYDLTVIVVLAAVVSFVFRYLKLPLILGYLLAGLIVGPNTFYQSFIHNEATIKELSGLGVIFLMFYIGLEFDLRKLRQVMVPALVAILLQAIAMVGLGIVAGSWLGWDSVTSLFLGGILAISSTMVTFSVLREQHALKKSFAQIAIGLLILDDIVAILLLVILTGVATTGGVVWGVIWQNIFFVGVFVMMVFCFGKLLMPTILNTLKRFESEELMLLVAVALVLGVGTMAEQFNFSIALGAFLAGAILSQTLLAGKIERTMEPLRDLFNAVFFVTVGMLIEPANLLGAWLPILTISLFVIAGKTVTVIAGLFLTGQHLRNAFPAAMCKAQIGEFSFVIATLGARLGVTDSELSTIVVGVALITIMLSPLLMSQSDNLYFLCVKRTPKSLRQLARAYTSLLHNVREQLSRSDFLRFVRRPILQISGYFLLFNGIISVAYVIASFISDHNVLGNYTFWGNLGIWLLAALLSLPFLLSLIRNLDALLMLMTEAALISNRFNQLLSGRFRLIIHNIFLSLALVLCGGIYLLAAAEYFPEGVALLAFLLLLVGVGFFFRRGVIRVNSYLEHWFIDSLERPDSDINGESRSSVLKKISEQYPWPVKLSEVIISPDSTGCGRRIADLRSPTGTMIVALSRSDYTIDSPDPATYLFPGDHLVLISNADGNEQIELTVKPTAEIEEPTLMTGAKMIWEKIYLTRGSPLAGETLAGMDLRRKYQINVVGMQRGNKRMISPDSDKLLLAGDILLLVGNPKKLKYFNRVFGYQALPQEQDG